jgi:hypothetical protein
MVHNIFTYFLNNGKMQYVKLITITQRNILQTTFENNGRPCPFADEHLIETQVSIFSAPAFGWAFVILSGYLLQVISFLTQ